MIHIANEDITVSCIYGTYTLKKGEQVSDLVAKKFCRYVTSIEDPVKEIVIENKEEPIEENKNEKKKDFDELYSDEELELFGFKFGEMEAWRVVEIKIQE